MKERAKFSSLTDQDLASSFQNRIDLEVIAEFVTPGSKVLDIGCGDGALLEMLDEVHSIDGRGIELSQSGVNETVARGLSVIQGDADTDLHYYPDDAYDFVILSQTLQATRNPKIVLEHLLRIGRHAIVSFPNFGHWRVRWQLLFGGRMPVSKALPVAWYETPNIHFCTIRDFHDLCKVLDAQIVRAVALDSSGQRIPPTGPDWYANFWGEQAVFLLKRPESWVHSNAKTADI